jgi:hypothetical protein
MLIISTVVRWCGSRVAAGLHISTFDEIQELPTDESDAIDLVRTDDEGWQLRESSAEYPRSSAGDRTR